MAESEFRKDGRQIYAGEKLIAELNKQGGLDFLPGMAGPYKSRVIEFINSLPPDENQKDEQPVTLKKVGILIYHEDKIVAIWEGKNITVTDPSTKEFYAPLIAELVKNTAPEELETRNTPEEVKKIVKANDLPPFEKSKGVKTPGFNEWVKARKLTHEQVIAIIRRCEIE